MTSVGIFPDAEVSLLAVLVPAWPSYRFVTSMPDPVVSTTIRIHRISGAARNKFVDRPIIDIDVFATSDAIASQAAREVQSTLLSLAGTTVMNGVIQSVSVINGPRWLPEDNPNLVRYGATNEVLIHAL